MGAAAEPPRWVGTGHVLLGEPEATGEEVARAAVLGADPVLLVAFVAEDADLEGVVRGIRKVAPDVPLVGCSTAGEIGERGPSDASVTLLALGGPGFSARTGVASAGVAGDLRSAAEAAAAAAAAGPRREHNVLLLLSDGLGGDQQEVVRGAYAAVGAGLPLVGGCAGDGMRMKRTAQLHGDAVLRDAVVAAVIGSDAPLSIGVRHGWRPVGEPMVVSRSEGNHVHAIDDRPALDVYLERLDAPEEVRHDAAAFTRFASTHPLGLTRRSGEEVRFVAEADFETRSLLCIAQVPQGSLAWLMEGDERSVLDAADRACDEALEGLGGAEPIGMLAFDCIARRSVLGDHGIRQEFDRIEQRTGAPVVGLYTYGEIARTHGVTGFHNQTLVLLAIA